MVYLLYTFAGQPMHSIQRTGVILILLLLSSGSAWAGFYEGFEYFEAGK
jgi:hypothetical protein